MFGWLAGWLADVFGWLADVNPPPSLPDVHDMHLWAGACICVLHYLRGCMRLWMWL